MDYQNLKQQVLYHNHLYYDEAKPEISDKEYDKLYDQLETLEKAQGFKDWDSPTQRVGHTRGKVKHPYKLYSLQKVYEKEAVPSEFSVRTPKLDGACIAKVYQNGELIRTISRGDGEYGEDLNHLFKGDLNKKLTFFPEGKIISFVGECITFEKPDNYRNYVAGALNLKDDKEFASRKIDFVVHDVLGLPTYNYVERLALAKRNNFLTVLDKEQLKDIPTDGWVFRTPTAEAERRLGYTSKYPKFAVALKTRAREIAITLLKDVIWSVGRTGMVNPTGIVEPVLINGATVSRLTLHNIAFIEENDICIGDKICIERAGEIIPTYVSTVEKSPVRLRVSQRHAEEGIEASVRRVGPRLFVADKSVNDQKVLEHYVTQMNIQGLGPASIKKMGLTHISDLYKKQPWEALGVNGTKIAQEIEYSKTKPYENVLAGLGIPNVGASLARKIIQHIPKFSDLYQIEYEKIDKVGPKITEKILSWLDENYDWVIKLPVQLEQVIANDEPKRIVCITGTLDKPRKEIATMLEQKGFEVKNSVTKKTYALIHDGKIAGDKMLTAEKYGIKTVNYFENKTQVLEGNF